MENRKRNVHLHVMVTPDELAAIHERMAEAGISNAGAYVRKMALNGYILHIDLAPVLGSGEINHSGSGENRQFWSNENHQSGVASPQVVLFTRPAAGQPVSQ